MADVFVTFSDGTTKTADVPDGVTAEQFLAEAQRAFPDKQIQEIRHSEVGKPANNLDERIAARTSDIAEGAKALGVGAVKGVAGLSDLAQKGLSASFPPLQALKAAGVEIPGGDLADQVEAVMPKPKTSGAAYMHSIGEMLPGTVMMTPGLGLWQKLMLTAGQGGGAEAAGRMSTGGAIEGQNPLARIAGAMLGGIPAGVSAGMYPNSERLVYDATRGLAPEDFTEARRLAGILTEQKMPFTTAQLFGPFSSLPSLQSRISENPAVGPMIMNRLKTAPAVAKSTMDEFAFGVGNPGSSRWDARNNLQEAAGKALDQVRQKARGEYEQAMPLPFNYSQDQVRDLYDAVLNSAKEFPENSQAAKAIRAFAEQLVEGRQKVQRPVWTKDANGIRKLTMETVDGDPIFSTDSNQLNNVYKNLVVDTGNLPENFKGLPLKEIRALWKEHTPEFQPARDAYRKVMDDEYNPMSKSLTGDIARAGGGSQVDRNTAKDTMFRQVFPPAGRQPEQIQGLAADTRRTNPEAFPNFVAEHITQQVSTAMEHGARGAQAEVQAPGELKKLLIGHGENDKALNFNTALSEVAKGQGKNPRDVLKGFNNLMDALATYSNARVSNELAAVEVARNAESNVVSKMFGPMTRTARAIDDMFRAKEYRKVAELLLSDEGVAKLERLSHFAPGSPVTKAVIADLFNSALQAETENPASIKRK